MCVIMGLFIVAVLGVSYLFYELQGPLRTGVMWGLLVAAYLAKKYIARRDLANLAAVVLWGAAIYLAFLWFK